MKKNLFLILFILLTSSFYLYANENQKVISREAALLLAKGNYFAEIDGIAYIGEVKITEDRNLAIDVIGITPAGTKEVFKRECVLDLWEADKQEFQTSSIGSGCNVEIEIDDKIIDFKHEDIELEKVTD